MFDSLEHGAEKTFSTVLYTKQHSLIDISAAMAVARKAYEKNVDEKFDDFTGRFQRLQQEHPAMPFRRIQDKYEQFFNEMRETPFLEVIRRELEEGKYPLISPEQPWRGSSFA